MIMLVLRFLFNVFICIFFYFFVINFRHFITFEVKSIYFPVRFWRFFYS